jgi:hypothetical protein
MVKASYVCTLTENLWNKFPTLLINRMHNRTVGAVSKLLKTGGLQPQFKTVPSFAVKLRWLYVL